MRELFDSFGDTSADYDHDPILAGDPDQAEAWTLGELHASSDLGSVRSAWARPDEQFA